MRIARRGTTIASLALAGALALAACSSDSGSDDSTSSGDASGGSSDAVITANGTEPQNPLVPTNTNEVGGGRIIDQIFAGLVYYDVDGTPVNEVAESIDTDDSQTYTIKIADGWTFTNGDPITASSFVDAWNFGALSTNAQLNASFFEPIEGYADVSAETPTAQTMSGLTVVDDSTFTVKLTQPESSFPLRLGYTAYFPLPKEAYDDMAAFGENPIGDGPYKLAEDGAWVHGEGISLVPNPDYKGGREVKNGGVDFKFYTSEDASYADVQAGSLDVLDQVPASAFATYQDDSSVQAYNQPGSVFQSFTIPERLPHFSGEEGNLRRQAISMSINREEITDKIFVGTRTPATDFVAPPINGWTDDLTGDEVLSYNPDEAKKLWAQADAISPWDGTFQISYNADSSHKDWVDAVSNSIKNTLGIDASGAPVATFDEFRESITTRQIQTAFRTGWQADYPSIDNYLVPLYASWSADGAGSNDGDYKSDDFDSLVRQAASASSVDAGVDLYHQAEEVLLKDLPAIPLWNSNVSAASSLAVSNVKFDWKNVPVYYAIEKS